MSLDRHSIPPGLDLHSALDILSARLGARPIGHFGRGRRWFVRWSMWDEL